MYKATNRERLAGLLYHKSLNDVSEDARSHSGSLAINETWCHAGGILQNTYSRWPLCGVRQQVSHAGWIFSTHRTSRVLSRSIWNWFIPRRFSGSHAVVHRCLAAWLVHLGSILHETSIKRVVLSLRWCGGHGDSRRGRRSSWRHCRLGQRCMWPGRHICANATN